MTYRRTQRLAVAVIVLALILISAVTGCGQKTSLDVEQSSVTDGYIDFDGFTGESPSAAEATKHLYKEYSEYFLLDADVVIKMEFVYAPTAYNENRDEVLLVPAWELTVKWHTLTDRYYGNEYDVCDVLTVKAVTGEIM